MIGIWLSNRRIRKECFHHNRHTRESYIKTALINLGANKLFECKMCGKRWVF